MNELEQQTWINSLVKAQLLNFFIWLGIGNIIAITALGYTFYTSVMQRAKETAELKVVEITTKIAENKAEDAIKGIKLRIKNAEELASDLILNYAKALAKVDSTKEEQAKLDDAIKIIKESKLPDVGNFLKEYNELEKNDRDALLDIVQYKKNIVTEQIQLGEKWKLSGIGDFAHNDDWLRLMDKDGTGYHGGFAAGRLYSSSDIHSQKVITKQIQIGEKWKLSGIGESQGNDEWLRLMDKDGKNYYGGFAANKLLSVSGNYISSDISLKKDIETLDNSLEKIKSLRGVSFKWKDKGKDDHVNIGLIAQEVEKTFPEAVSSDPQGKKGVNYAALVAPLINSIEEQDIIINKQKEQISNFEQRIGHLESLLVKE